MVSQENRLGLYVAIPLYFAILGIAAILSHKRVKQMERNAQTDQLSAHYLGGRSFGPIVIAGTIFASQFSGYTVVGVPNESFRNGFVGFRWMATFPAIVLGFVCTGMRLRKASLVRNHSTPVDFITDRFRSQILRYTVLIIQVLASLVYLAAQVNALQSTFNAMFGFDPADIWPVIVIMAIILSFEWAGGLAVVALSDSIQGIVMAISFTLMPLVILYYYGGWNDLDPLTYPRPDFYQTPSSEDQWLFWQFSLINYSFFALPHLMQRIYAAKDLSSLKVGFYVQTAGPWLTSFVGVFIGTMGVKMLADAGVDDPPSPFAAIVEQLLKKGGFAEATGVMALTASLAAIMSTADSLIIAISQLITVECIWPLMPNASQGKLAWVGRFASLFSVCLALITGILWKSGVSALAAINFPVIIQSVPTYLHGLYCPTEKQKFHPWSLAIGAWTGTIYVFAFFFGYTYQNSVAKPINAGIVGFILNVIGSFATNTLWFKRSNPRLVEDSEEEMLLHDQERRPKWDIPSSKRFGEGMLTSSLLNRMMVGFPEPMRRPIFNLFFFFTVSMITPLVAEGQPAIDVQTGSFVSEPPTVRGLPWWFMKQILLTVIPYVVLIKLIYDIPNDYAFDEDTIDRVGIDPELLELAPTEINFRNSFDTPNESILRRRNTISSKMEALGISAKSVAESEKSTGINIPENMRLSFIIKDDIAASRECLSEKLQGAFREELDSPWYLLHSCIKRVHFFNVSRLQKWL